MNRRAVASLALALLLVPVALAATPSGARPPIDADGNVNDVALSASGRRFAAAGDDPGSVLGSPSAPTWRLWDIDGSLRQTGSIDPQGCPSSPTPLGEDCQTRATRVALSSSGGRIAVAGQTGPSNNPGDAVVGIFSDAGTVLASAYPLRIPGVTVHAIAFSENGNQLVVGGSRADPDVPGDTDGFLGSYGSTGKVFEAGTESPVTAVAVNADGNRLAAAAGHSIRANPQEPGPGSAGTLHHNRRSDGTSAVQGTQVSVDISDHPRGWSVAGYNSGFFAVFSDPQGGPGGAATSSVQDYQKREGSDSSSLSAVAIRPDATAFATGSANGRLRLYALDPSVDASTTAVQPTLVATLEGQGGFVDLAFSGDGRYLAARAGGGVRFYDTQGGSLTQLWSDDRAGLAPSVGIDHRGEHVVAAVGSSVILYDAIHAIGTSFPSSTQAPGATAVHKLTYRNDGNRVEAVQLTAAAPSGVSVGLSPASFTLKPGAVQAIDATVGVPSTFPPGPLKVNVTHALNGGLDGNTTRQVSLTVPTVRDVRLDPQGATSKGAGGGSPATFEVEVANRGNTVEQVELRAPGAPAGWGVEVEPARFELSPGEVQEVVVTVTPPSGARDGQAASVSLQRLGGPAAPVELTATVGASFGVRLVVPAGTVLRPGVSGLVNATVRNEGNAIDTIKVELGALPAGWRGGFLNGMSELEVEDIEPGGQRLVQVSLEPPAGSASEVPVQVSMTASSLADPSKTNSKGVLVTVQEPSTESATTTGGDGNGIPGPGLALVAAALAAAALLARRRP
jgi:uncharacterized membrane protein/WD40 repeat protein